LTPRSSLNLEDIISLVLSLGEDSIYSLEYSVLETEEERLDDVVRVEAKVSMTATSCGVRVLWSLCFASLASVW
jgi:hypothetical protein